MGKMVKYCEGKKKRLTELTLGEMHRFSVVFDDAVRAYIDPVNILKSRKTIGGASHKEVAREIAREQKYLRH